MFSVQHIQQIFSDGAVPFFWVLGLLVISTVLVFFFTYFLALHRWKRIYRKRSHSVVKGLVNEQLAPLLTRFPGRPSDARFLGKPVDYIVFRGLSDGFIDEIIFVEVKSRRGLGLTPNERLVRDAVKEKRIRWMVYSIDGDAET